jgi:hypothetical protein
MSAKIHLGKAFPACGTMSKNLTEDVKQVTCKSCGRALERELLNERTTKEQRRWEYLKRP